MIQFPFGFIMSLVMNDYSQRRSRLDTLLFNFRSASINATCLVIFYIKCCFVMLFTCGITSISIILFNF